MKLKELLAWRPTIEKRLSSELTREIALARAESRHLVPFLEATQEFNLRGGKRFRALLVLAGYHVAGGKDLAVPVPAAAALETFQSWMLIHDDVMDHGEKRRGGPTMHVSMAEYHSKHELDRLDSDFGEAMAITLGDLMEAVTTRGLLAVKVPAERKVALMAEYSQMTRLTAYGQLLDVYLGASPLSRVNEQDVLTIHRLKTAAYTVSSPLRMGAILAGGSPALQQRLGKIGDDLGVAFQLRDDVLGLGLGDNVSLDKSTNDLFEGKRTLLVIEAWRRASRKGREVLERVLGNPIASPRQLDDAIEVIRATGSLDYSEERIAQLRDRAYKALGTIPKDRADLLREIGQMLTDRAK